MIIVGGGSAGLYLADKYLQKAKQKNSLHNNKVIVLEEHKQLGVPVQCTGILTNEIESIIANKEIAKFALNKITNACIHSPNTYVSLKIQPNIIIDNRKFVEYLSDRAEKSGAEIMTGHRYISNNGSEIKVKNISSGKIKSFRDSELVGADGPLSKVALNNYLNSKREHLLGIQARVKIRDLDKNRIDFFPHIGEYAWSVPENEEIARVGIALPFFNQTKNNNKNDNNNNKLFEDFLKKFPGKKLETQGGLIPLHKPGAKISIQNKDFSVALLGDAASQIKNTTGGGIIPGIKAAENLSQGIKEYPSNLKGVNRELYFHYILHKALSKYDDRDWDRLVNKVKNEGVQNALSEHNRDNSAKILLALSTKKGMISEGAIALSKLFQS